jgi:hypothetical protein
VRHLNATASCGSSTSAGLDAHPTTAPSRSFVERRGVKGSAFAAGRLEPRQVRSRPLVELDPGVRARMAEWSEDRLVEEAGRRPIRDADRDVVEHAESVASGGRGRLRVAPRRRPVGDDATEAPAMTRCELVEPVEERRRVGRGEQTTEPTRPGELLECDHAPARVAGERRPVGEDEPPPFAARLVGHCGEQRGRLVVAEREQSEFLLAIEPGNDPRRPPAEPSPAVVEEHGPGQQRRGRRVVLHWTSVCGRDRVPRRTWQATRVWSNEHDSRTWVPVWRRCHRDGSS